MLTVALLTPTLVGVSVITKLVPPAAIVLAGTVVTDKWAAFGPVKKIGLIFKVPLVLVIEKVPDVFVPKSVLFAVVVTALCGTLLPFPLTASVTVGADVVVNPLATPPGLTQLETVPVNANVFKVPVLAPVASVNNV